MKWLITGAAGYIGSNLAHKLVADGFEIQCTDLVRNPRSSFLESKGAKFLYGDLRDANFTETLFDEDQTYGVIHLAGLKSVTKSFGNRSEYFDTNVKATGLLHSQSIAQGVRQFLLASSAAIYDKNAINPIKESAGINPASYYGETKVLAEEILGTSNKMQSLALRFFNVVGSSEAILRDTSEDNVLPIFLKSMSQDESPRVFGDVYETPDGSCIRDYVHINDIVTAIKLIMMKDKSLPGQLNIGSGIGVSVIELISVINKYLKTSILPVITSPREGDVGKVVADVRLLADCLGFKPSLTVERAIQDYLVGLQHFNAEKKR
jgi:UDP-glucose 4-epimerase